MPSHYARLVYKLKFSLKKADKSGGFYYTKSGVAPGRI